LVKEGTVGTLDYGGIRTIEIDDRSLAHVQLVIAAKLRRGEAFTYNAVDSASAERSALWLHPAIPMVFVFADPAPIRINRDWLEALSAAANTSQGLRLTAEPTADNA
jgi:hypothetical protein